MQLFPTPLKIFILNRLAEISGLLSIFLSIFIIISIFTYSPIDPNLSHFTNASTANLGGQLGANLADILIQFLFEALILSTIGGLVGTTTGLTGVFLLGVITPLPASVGITTTLSTMIISGSIGLIFGVLPAKRASQLDPIVALRSL